MSPGADTQVTQVSRSGAHPGAVGCLQPQNHLRIRRVGPLASVAGTLLSQWRMARVLIGSLTVLGWGCLVPQDDTPLNPPVFRNYAPYFVNSSPASAYIRTDNCVGTSLEFRVNVADPDLDDSVRVRYYVDFPEPNQLVGEKEEQLSNTGSEVRPETVVYAPIVFSAGSALSAARIHTVEAVVFDGTLSPTRTPEPRSVTTDGGVNPSYLAIVRWVVETEDCAP